MNIKNALSWAQNKLNKSKLKSAGLDAEILLCYVLNMDVEMRSIASLPGAKKSLDKSFFYAHPEYRLTDKQTKKYKKNIKRRATGDPVAYIVGEKQFYGLKFLVNKSVLVPRPETEESVHNAQLIINKGGISTMMDVGTGSGCIAVSLAKNNPNLKIYATDICKRALRVAEKNAKYYKVEKQINFLQGNLLEPTKNKKLDIVIANLPYLDLGHKNLLNSSETVGLKFEPQKALYAGKDGLDKYRELFGQLGRLKHKPKYVLCEIGDKQVGEFKNIIKIYLDKTVIKIKKDLAGLYRVAVVQI